MERAKRETAIRGVAGDIAFQVIGTKPAMARAAVVIRKRRCWRCGYFRRSNFRYSHDEWLPIDSDPEFSRQGAGRRNRQIGARTLEIDHDREFAFDVFVRQCAFGRQIRVRDVWRRASAPGEHPSNSREMFSPEKYFAVDNKGRYSEDSRVEGIALDIVVEQAALAGRVVVKACRPRAGFIEYALDRVGVFEVEIAPPETLVNEMRVCAEHRS